VPINSEPIKDYIDNYTKLLSVMSNPDIFNNLNLNTVVDSIKRFNTAITDSFKDFNIGLIVDSINSLDVAIKDIFKDFNVSTIVDSINALNEATAGLFKDFNVSTIVDSINALNEATAGLFKDFNVSTIVDSINALNKATAGLFKDFNVSTIVDSINAFNTAITDLFAESTSLLSNVVSSFNQLNEIDLTPINNKVNDLVLNLRNTFNDPIGIKLNIDSQLNTMLTNLHEKEAIILTKQLDQLINNGNKLDIIANNISNSKSSTQLSGDNNKNTFISNNVSDTKTSFLKNIVLETSNLAYS